MLRFLIVAITAVALTAGAAAEELLPRPVSLEPAVEFWTRVYTEVGGDGGFIHDSVHLGVVYEVVRFPDGLSRRSRERRVEKSKDRYRAILKRLAKGKRTGLTGEEATLLSHWPDGVSNSTLKRAAGNLRFQLGQSDKFRAGLERSGRWRAYIEKTLRDHGVPVELANLPHVESSFNPKAYSRVGAAGLWQFTRGTGRRYLRVDHVVDERMDPFAATVGAARLLRDNFRLTKSWPLAITSYNHGAAGMRRAAQKLGTRDIGTIVAKYKSRTFGFASRNFYTSFLAALHVDRNAEKYFGTFSTSSPVSYTIVELPHFYPVPSLARAFGVEKSVLREHNGALRPSVWNGSKYVPKGFGLRVPSGYLKEPPTTLLASVPEADRLTKQHRDRYYKVRRGDTLGKIARRFEVKERELVALNNLRSRNRIRVGQVLTLPDDAAGAPIQVARQERPADGRYKVRRGDNLTVIARRFGVSERELAKANGIKNRNRIAVGQTLRIPGAAPAAAPKPVVIAKVEPKAAPRPEPKAAPKAEPVVVARAEPRATTAAAPQPPPSETVVAVAPAATPEPVPAVADEVAEAAATPSTRADASGSNGATPDPSDYAVHGDRVTIQADETLGHYADWLETRASTLRAKNGMKFGQDLVIGRRLRLDFTKVTPEEFERRRLEYHRDLQEEFFEAYAVTGTEQHVLKRGESLWYLANKKYQLPVWLLRQYNPDLDFGQLHAGVAMVVPTVEPRQG